MTGNAPDIPSFDRPPVPTPPPVQGLRLMVRVIGALILQEVTNRYGQYKLGYLWALVEPTFAILIFVLIFTLVGRFDGVDLIPFLLAGFGSLFCFLNVGSRTMSGSTSNRNLLGLVQVQVIDVMVARALSEAPKWILVLFFINTIAIMLGHSYWPANGLASILSLLGVVMLGFGWGMIFGPLIVMVPMVKTVQAVLNRAWFFTSGIFFSIDVMPEPIRSYLLINPLLHFIEIQRAAFSGTPLPDGISTHYGAFAIIWFIAFGLVLERNARGVLRRG